MLYSLPEKLTGSRESGDHPAPVHTQNGVARLQQRGVNSEVSLRTGVRLHVSVVSAEQFFRAVDSQLLYDINVFATAVVALARITFSVFVGQLRPCACITRGLV